MTSLDNNYIDRMQAENMKLPPLHSPLSSSKIHNFQDYAQWDRQKKQAYRKELKQEMEQHDRSRKNLLLQKEREKVEINAIVKEERSRNQEDRHMKIKTEQKYMQDNWNLLQETHQKSQKMRSKPTHKPESSYKEHPFVRLVEQQDQRQQQTKRNFIFQNKLNDLQSEMKREQAERRKIFQSEERRIFDEHIDDQYRKKRRERQQFESKYLKIDKSSDGDCKKEYFQYLKAQAALTRNHSRKKPQAESMHEANRASPGFIGLSPVNFDRIKQMQTIEKSLKLFNAPKQSRNRSTLEYQKPVESTGERKMVNNQKVLTERATPVVQNIATEPFETLQFKPSSRMISLQSQFSERVERPVRSPRPYKQFNIINCSDRIFMQ